MRFTQRATCLIAVAIASLAAIVAAAAPASSAPAKAHGAKGRQGRRHHWRGQRPGLGRGGPEDQHHLRDQRQEQNGVGDQRADQHGDRHHPRGRGPRGVAVDPKTNTIYVTTDSATGCR